VPRLPASRILLAASVVLAGCGDSHGPTPPPTVDCSDVPLTQLAVGEHTIIDAAQTACVRIPGGGSGGSEYLYAALATEGTETINGITADYKLLGGAQLTASAGRLSPSAARRPPSRAAAFHSMLRRREHELSRRSAVVEASRARISASIMAEKPVVGDKRSFDVCKTVDCDEFVPSAATAKLVADRVAIFVDDDTPAAYSDADLAEVGQLFDDFLYPIDTTAFGRESDIDANSVVIVLLSPLINKLSPSCTNSVILGYFFGLDLLPSQGHSNGGEVFYGLVPGTVEGGCEVSEAFALRNLPPVFIHEFQHMISFNQHVLVRNGNSAEDTWLNEGLSHYAEELGGRNVPDVECPGFDSCREQFIGSNIENAYEYLDDPESNFLIEPGNSSGTLAERGANWLFVRWLADHFADTQPNGTELTRALDGTNRTGGANVAAVTGVDFSTLVSEWQLANYLDNLPGFTPASDRLQYSSWDFRGLFQLNFDAGVFAKPYPLTPDSTKTGEFNRTGVLRAGSGRHLRIIQPAGSGEVSFLLTDDDGTSVLSNTSRPRVALVRIR
jgi:hypothetical protein